MINKVLSVISWFGLEYVLLAKDTTSRQVSSRLWKYDLIPREKYETENVTSKLIASGPPSFTDIHVNAK